MENSHGLLRLNIRLECNFLTRWIRITECLSFFIFGVLGGARGLGSREGLYWQHQKCRESGSCCYPNSRPASQVFEGQSYLICRDSLGIHKQMNGYFYFPFCLFKQITESCTHIPVLFFHWTIIRDCSISVQLPHFLFVATEYSTVWICVAIPLWVCF